MRTCSFEFFRFTSVVNGNRAIPSSCRAKKKPVRKKVKSKSGKAKDMPTLNIAGWKEVFQDPSSQKFQEFLMDDARYGHFAVVVTQASRQIFNSFAIIICNSLSAFPAGGIIYLSSSEQL